MNLDNDEREQIHYLLDRSRSEGEEFDSPREGHPVHSEDRDGGGTDGDETMAEKAMHHVDDPIRCHPGSATSTFSAAVRPCCTHAGTPMPR